MPNKRHKPGKAPKPDAKTAKMVADSAATIVEWAAQALGIVEKFGIKNEPVEHFWLSPAQRDVILTACGPTKAIKGRLANGSSSFTINEVASMMNALAEQLPKVEARKRTAIVLVVKHLMERLQDGTAGPAKPKDKKEKEPRTKVNRKALYQFKINLKDSTPPIWRRIQVADCTLDKFHEHIQTAMGWTNSHLHHFRVGEQLYGDPMLMEEDMEAMHYKDSTRTKISKIVPVNGKPSKFQYEYDFGDGWEHEILFEGCPSPEKGKKYPLCVEGARACPPEDVGGIDGFYNYLEALADPKHEEHEQFMKWRGPFDPEMFDAGEATKAMKQGLPEWR